MGWKKRHRLSISHILYEDGKIIPHDWEVSVRLSSQMAGLP